MTINTGAVTGRDIADDELALLAKIGERYVDECENRCEIRCTAVLRSSPDAVLRPVNPTTLEPVVARVMVLIGRVRMRVQ